jgi:hypothetical protein
MAELGEVPAAFTGMTFSDETFAGETLDGETLAVI